ncbi:hypothetical protein DL95DRAFT_396243 [Leptodontidium sp. 2 PMI_412]|nr:hypothetical protein DL95DRAFT_396243 [Leptodontidium sp. 2 PMI_412]
MFSWPARPPLLYLPRLDHPYFLHPQFLWQHRPLLFRKPAPRLQACRQHLRLSARVQQRVRHRRLLVPQQQRQQHPLSLLFFSMAGLRMVCLVHSGIKGQTHTRLLLDRQRSKRVPIQESQASEPNILKRPLKMVTVPGSLRIFLTSALKLNTSSRGMLS